MRHISGRDAALAVLSDPPVRAIGIDEPVDDPVRDVARAYQPGTGDDADVALDRLVMVVGGYDELTAARIGVLVQAREAGEAVQVRLAGALACGPSHPTAPATR